MEHRWIRFTEEVRPHGAEVNGYGVPGPFVALSPSPPIIEVILLVAGPAGFGTGVLDQFEATLMGDGRNNTGCHVGPLRLAVPSPGGRTEIAALGDLFMFHDRDTLVPVMEDLRLLGAEEYSSWTQLLCGAAA